MVIVEHKKGFPEEVIATTKKGKKEARVLKETGEYIWYSYVDLESGEEEKKTKLVLVQPGVGMKEYFVFPTSDGKRLLLVPVENKGERMVYDPETGEMVHISESGVEKHVERRKR